MKDLELVILTNLQKNEEYARKVFPFLKQEYFENKVNREYYKFLDGHFSKYSVLPSKDTTTVSLQELRIDETTFKEMVKLAINIFKGKIETEIDWLVDKTEEFCQNRALYLALMESVDIAQKGDSDKVTKTSIPDLLSTALAVSFDTQIGHDYIEDSDERFARYKEKKHKIKFHIDMLNQITGGGIEKKTINCVLSPTGGGKTMFMCDLSANWMKDGYNVLYITNEMAEENIALRIDANLMNTEIGKIKEMDKNSWKKKVENLKKSVVGKLKIKEYPTGTAHVGHFRFLLKELKQKQKFIPDIIVIDYLNICASAKYKDKSNSYGYIKSVTEELRGFASEQNVAMFTATQTNRSGQNTTELDMSNVSESMGGPMTMDLFFGLISNEEMAKMGQVMITQLKNRYEDVFKDKVFMIGVDRPKMKFYDLQNATPYLANQTQSIPQSNNAPVLSTKHNNVQKGNFSGIKV